MKCAIIGATGYGGAELVRILNAHPNVTIHSVHATSLLNEPLTNSYEHMQKLIDQTIEDVNIEKISRQVDIVFLATPSGVAKDLAKEFLNKNIKVIDLSGDFRLKDRTIYKEWYGIESADSSLLEKATYGLSEWVNEDFTDIQLLSNPGCFPTSVLLGVIPLVKENIIDVNSLIVDSKTGVSGAGRGISAATHFSETNDNFKIYNVNKHQHTPEIEQGIRFFNDSLNAITFSTHLAPMTRGIMSTIYATATDQVNEKQLFDLFYESYNQDYFIRVKQPGYFPSTKEVYASNFCDISLSYDERTNRITVVTVIDNLVKGASGQAVQNMNKMIGIDEHSGLDFMPVFP